MKLSSIKYLTFDGLKNIWANRLMSVASIGVLVSCMLLIGAAILVSLNVDAALSTVEKENVILAYFKDYNSVRYADAGSDEVTIPTDENGNIPPSAYYIHNDDEGRALCKKIEELDNVASVEFISSEQGLKSIINTLPEDQAEYISQLQEKGENPLSCAGKIVLEDLTRFDETLNLISGVEGIDSIHSNRDVVNKVTSLSQAVTVAGYFIIGILLIISLVIVANTIRVTMFNRKLEIGIMKAVGATDSFIRFPFVVEGVVIGLISAVLSTGLLYFVYEAVETAIEGHLGVLPIAFTDVVFQIAGVFVAIGFVAGAFGSSTMIGKYLKREGSEFSAI